METLKEQQELPLKLAYAEATRYMNNAEETLKKSVKEDKYYRDDKYVRVACGTAYLGVLKALDGCFEFKGIPRPPKKKRASIEYYKSNLAQLDGKMLTQLNDVYQVLHLNGCYEGVRNVAIIRSGFDSAYGIIARIKPAHELTPDEVKTLRAQKIPAWLRPLSSLFALL
ncbi:MAG: DUF5618 family protein [Prevotellaceae bacterium]|jgi:hypothetical protein|nr:DUF5618 family protein [Prevotellaceae bacterium]